MQIKKANICSIVVVYKPDLEELKSNIQQQCINFDFVLIINNDPEISIDFRFNNIKVKNNIKNLGLAEALNIGIAEAENLGFKIVALFDQDTLIDSDFNLKMIRNINSYGLDSDVGCFAPMVFDNNRNKYLSLLTVKKIRFSRKEIKVLENKIFHPDFVITSGSYIPIKNFKNIGYMDKNLFINFIDIEWCLRARYKKYKIVCFANCSIIHSIGDYSFSIFNHQFPVHSPLRLYYTFRNSIYCYRLNHISFSWKFVDFNKNLFRFIFYIFFIKDRYKYLKYIFKGVCHGLKNKMGEIE